MSVNIRVYPNKLDPEIFEQNHCEAGLTITQWLEQTVPAYYERDAPLMSMVLDGLEVEPEHWPIVVLNDGNNLEIFVEPKEPVTIAMAVIAVISAAAAIYYANQSIPDTYNSSVPKGSPIYSVNAQGNQPRLMGVVPEVLGYHKVFPDYLNQIRREYVDHEEYLYLMLSIGVGAYAIDLNEIYIGDTSIASFGDDIDCQFFSPGQSVEGNDAHRNVHSSKEVGGSNGQSGFELKGSIALGVLSVASGSRAFVQYGNRDSLGTHLDGNAIGETFDFIAQSKALVGDYIEIFDADNALYNGTYLIKDLDNSEEGVVFRTSHLAKVDPVTLDIISEVDFLPSLGSLTSELFYRFGANYYIFRAGAEGSEVGPYKVSPSGVGVYRAYLDFKFPEGLCVLDDLGVPTAHSVSVLVEWREDGGVWNGLEYMFSASVVDARAYTVVLELSGAEGIEVKVSRLTPEVDDLKYKEKCEWTALRSELPAASSYPGVTTMALRVKGTNVLASTAENKVNLIVKRHLPTWSGSAFGGVAATNDIAPAVKYLADQAGLPVDMDELKRLHDIWQARGDEFNGVFDNATTAWEALKRVLAVGFAEPTLDYGQLIPVRDEQRSNIEYMYAPQNILPNSWSMSASLFDASEPDGVEVEYMDGSGGTWKSGTILCTLPGETGENPEKVRAFGITDRTKAYQYGMRKRSAMRYRRKQHKFATEMDGLNSNYLSYDGLGIESPSFSQTGELIAFNGRTLTLSEDVEFGTGTHYIALRKANGTASGPYVCTQGAASNEVILASDLDFVPVINGRQEPPFYMFGVASEWCERVLIQKIEPSGTDRVNITAINDDDRVYAYDDAVAPS